MLGHIQLMLGVFLAAPLLTPEQPSQEKAATEMIARMSGAYRAMRSSVMVRGEITRRKSHGEIWQETKRGYRLIQTENAIRSDVCKSPQRKLCGFYLRRGSEVVICLPGSRSFAILEKTDPRADAIQAALGAIQIALYGRLADLARTNYSVTSFRETELKVNGGKKRCYHIKLRPGEGETKTWTGELWIDAESALVWRATLVKEDKNAEWPLIQETVSFLEYASGKDVPLEELEWKPPVNAERLSRVPTGPLPQ